MRLKIGVMWTYLANPLEYVFFNELSKYHNVYMFIVKNGLSKRVKIFLQNKDFKYFYEPRVRIIEVPYIEMLPLTSLDLCMKAFLLLYEDYLMHLDIDMMYLHELYTLTSFQASMKIKKTQYIPTAVEVHNLNSNIYKNAILKNISTFVLKNVDFIRFLTFKSAKATLKTLRRVKPHAVIYPGIDLKIFTKTEKTEIHGEITLLYIAGRFDYSRGTDIVLKSFLKLIRKNLGKINLIIVGESGSLEQYVRKYVLKYKNSIVWLKSVSYIDIPKLYTKAHFLLYPVRPYIKYGVLLDHVFGYPIIEAMASELVVITSTHGPFDEIVGDAGIILNDSMLENIDNVIIKMVKDSGRYSLLAEKAKDRARKLFNLDTNAHRLAQRLQQIATYNFDIDS